jgi:glucokinase
MTTSVIAALDIGGSKLAVTLAHADGPLIRLVQPTRKSGTPDAIAHQSLQLLAEACRRKQIDFSVVRQLGVSSCGPFEYVDGLLGLTPPNLCGGLAQGKHLPNDWTFIPLESVLREHFTTIHIDNDCVGALRGELHFGAAQKELNAIYVTWSTGIGFGLCVDGHLLRGKSRNAGHAGHMLMSDISEAICGCGNYGDLESLVGGRNLSLRLSESLDKLFSSAQSGDQDSLDVIQEAAHWFGRGLYNLIVTLDTQCVLVGGSVWRENEALLAPLVQAEISGRFPALTQGVAIQSALLGELVTDIGALTAVMPKPWIEDWRTRRPWQALQSELID